MNHRRTSSIALIASNLIGWNVLIFARDCDWLLLPAIVMWGMTLIYSLVAHLFTGANP